jgi:hypothetical protein
VHAYNTEKVGYWGGIVNSAVVERRRPVRPLLLNDADKGAAYTLAERIADEHLFGMPVFDIDLGSESVGARVQEIKGEKPPGRR